MKPMDFVQFKKWIRSHGYSVGYSTKHHVVLDSNGMVVAFFAVSHKASGKDYVKPAYIAKIKKELGL